MRTAAESAETAEPVPWQESLSAWMDGETPGARPEGLSTPAGREAWETYHLIGDVLRNPELARGPSPALRQRLAQAIEAEMTIVAPRRRPLRVGLSGLAVAAAVASVVWMARPYFSAGDGGGEVQVMADAAGADAPALRDYLEAHRQMAGPSAVRQVSFDAGAGR